jgi:hypothetical protein
LSLFTGYNNSINNANAIVRRQSYEELFMAAATQHQLHSNQVDINNGGIGIKNSTSRTSTTLPSKSIIKKQHQQQQQQQQQPPDCQYAQLLFDQQASGPPRIPQHSTFASDDSVLYMNSIPNVQRYQTNYATIDHSRRHHNKAAKINNTRQKGLMHSSSCPFKVRI